ncbi:MAG: Crp/Fnr family transcriptional regulator [Actinomycetales bacterium]|uniref:Crp/Fnr family transcriptional regulator n=1 Tax=Candidatus Phosphoribacter hodrii TaxID=2953743 RepID=A0A935ILL9_9MICO|nr:Crp/Fnr family transcriptional regulator [Candidatus Phosphoribacter hodrii]
MAGVGDLVGSLPSVLPAGMPDLLSAKVAESTWQPQPQWGQTNRSAIAIVDTVVERMDMRVLMSLMRRHAAWAMVGYHAMALHAMGQERRARDLLTLSAQERYLNFLVQAPELIGLLPQKDIAAYIGVTPVGLSRIAARSRR